MPFVLVKKKHDFVAPFLGKDVTLDFQKNTRGCPVLNVAQFAAFRAGILIFVSQQ